MESALGPEGGVHTMLAGVDYRVFWWTRRKLEGHTGGIRRSLRKCTVSLIGKVERKTSDLFTVALRFIPNI